MKKNKTPSKEAKKTSKLANHKHTNIIDRWISRL